MAKYIFSIHRMHIIVQRSAADERDSDWLYFAVKINDTSPIEIKGQISLTPNDIMETIRILPGGEPENYSSEYGSGAVLKFPNSCQIGPVEVGPEDSVLVTASVLNQGATDHDKQAADYLKFAGAASQLLARGIVLATLGAGSAVGAALNEFGEIVSNVGEVLGWFSEEKNCNGLVFIDINQYTGKRLQELTHTSAHILTTRGTSQISQQGCGADPQTEVTLSIRESSSLRQFLQVRGLHPNPGIRSLTNPAILSVNKSVRALISDVVQ